MKQSLTFHPIIFYNEFVMTIEKVDLNQDVFSSKVDSIFVMNKQKDAQLEMMQTLAPSVLQMR